MSRNPEIYVFTEESMREHDMDIATKVHDATVCSVIRKVVRMNQGQVVRAARKKGKDLRWSDQQIETVLAHIND